MARLNEPPVVPQPSAENLDAVKRRFLRQNRELAKINSQQSIRIRTLENDCSRLLAENLALRENVLHLQNAVEARPAFDQIDSVAAQLEAKLHELGGLVAGLAQCKKGSRIAKRKSLATAKRRSGEPRQWRSGLGLQEVENGMLPTISEDKFFPRRTMCADEIEAILDNADSQSPDIGPPPVSRFENEQPISFDIIPDPEEQAQDVGDDEEAALLSNLETRKKRRESGPKLNIRRVSVFESPEEAEESSSKPARTGAKRKFSVQEDEEKDEQQTEPFRFSRRNVPIESETEELNGDPKPASPARPVLGPKPVNTDPVVSPKKQRSISQGKPEKNLLPTNKPRGRARLNINRNTIQPDHPLLRLPEPISTADIILEPLHPKTPAVEDIFSPPSTEPSNQRPGSKDTPPPGDLSSSDQIGQAARPGRRARPQVSYKEPSLHTKMRRPDAKLVDAVVERRTSVEPQAAPLTVIKSDSSGELSWKPVSTVSGRSGEDEGEIGSPLRQKLDRRETTQENKPASTTQLDERPATSKAISALILETSAAKRKTASDTESTSAHQDPPIPKKDATAEQEPLDKDSLAVFEFTDSSPLDTNSNNPRPRISDLAKAARNARRHSSVPATSSFSASSMREDEQKQRKAEGALSSLHKRTGSGSVKTSSTPLLATSMLGKSTNAPASRVIGKYKKPAAAASMAEDDSIEVRIPPSQVETLKESASSNALASKAMATATLRAERAASRRKSMLL